MNSQENNKWAKGLQPQPITQRQQESMKPSSGKADTKCTNPAHDLSMSEHGNCRVCGKADTPTDTMSGFELIGESMTHNERETTGIKIYQSKTIDPSSTQEKPVTPYDHVFRGGVCVTCGAEYGKTSGFECPAQEKPEYLDEAIAEIQWGNFVGHYLRDEDGNFHPIADSYGVLDEHFKNDVKSLINSEVSKALEDIMAHHYAIEGAKRNRAFTEYLSDLLAKYKEGE